MYIHIYKKWNFSVRSCKQNYSRAKRYMDSNSIFRNDDQSFRTGEFAVPCVAGAHALIFVRESYPFAKSRFAKLASFSETRQRISPSQIHDGELENRLLLTPRRTPVRRVVPLEFRMNKLKREVYAHTYTYVRDMQPGEISSQHFDAKVQHVSVTARRGFPYGGTPKRASLLYEPPP